MRPPPARPRRGVIPSFLAGFAAALMITSLWKSAPTPQNVESAVRSRLMTVPEPQQRDQAANLVRHRKKVVAVVGVQTGFTTDHSNPKYDYTLRRQALRNTWFPSSQAALDRLEASSGIVLRFVIGHTSHAKAEAEVNAEEKAHGGFLRLPIQEEYLNLTNKTLTFFRTVVEQYNPQYIIKVDDDVYLRLDRVPAAVAQWSKKGADYVGCMKTGPIYTSRNYRWFEPQHAVLGGQSYFTHSWGTIYVLSGHAAELLAAMNPSQLRFFANEDVTVGAWMLALRVQHYDDRRLCETICSESSIAVFDFPQCAGLCEAQTTLPLLHKSENCRMPALKKDGTLPELPVIIDFTIDDDR